LLPSLPVSPTILVAAAIPIALLIASTLKKPAYGLGLLIFFLPAFSLFRRLFNISSVPYPSLETISIFLIWVCAKVREVKKKREARNIDVRLVIAIWVFLSAGLVSSVASNNPLLSIKILFSGGVAPIVCFIIAYKYVDEFEDIRYILGGIFGLAVQAGLYTAYSYLDRAATGGAGLNLYRFIYGSGGGAVANLLFVPSVTVSTIVYAVPLSFFHRQHGTKYRKTLWPTVLFMCLLVGILSFSRGSWFGLLVAFVASIPLVFRKAKASRVVFVSMIVIILLFVFITGFYETPVDIIRYRTETFSFSGSQQSRLENNILAIKSGQNHIFWGVGLGQYREIYSEFPNDPASRLEPLWFAHSLFLTLIPEIGIFGMLAFLYIFLLVLAGGFRYSFSGVQGERRDLIYALLVGVVSYIIIASTSGAHVIAYLGWPESSTYFVAPALVVTFIVLGCMYRIYSCE